MRWWEERDRDGNFRPSRLHRIYEHTHYLSGGGSQRRMIPHVGSPARLSGSTGI
jgi:hypothetical protein